MTLSRALLQLVIINNTQLMGDVATDGAQLIWILGQCITAIYQGSAVTTVPSSASVYSVSRGSLVIHYL